MIEKLKSVFEEINLGENEAEVYLVCLKLGPSTVLQIAKKTNIIRATLYKILGRLEAKGLVSQIEKEGRTYHVAEDPKSIIERVKEEEARKKKALDTAQNLITGLTKIAKETDHPHVRLFEGQKALTELWLMPTTTASVEEISMLIDFDTLCSYLPEKAVLKFRDQRLEKNVKLKILRKKHKKTLQVPEHDKQELREKRFLPDDFDLNAGFITFKDRVIIITTPGEPFGILIESKFFSDTIRSIFDKLWESAERE